MINKLFLFSVYFLLVCFGPVAFASTVIFEPEEYKVYEVVFQEWLPGVDQALPVVRDHTALAIGAKDLEKELLFVKDSFAGTLQTTLNDFKAKAIHSYYIGKFISERYKYDLITHKEVIELFSYKDGWQKFKVHYPHSDTIITFSRVGFNPSKSQALICVSSQWGDYSGAGVYLLLDKNSLGVWSITQSLRVWHSWIAEEENTILEYPKPGELIF